MLKTMGFLRGVDARGKDFVSQTRGQEPCKGSRVLLPFGDHTVALPVI